MTDLNHVVLIGRLTQDLGADERSFGYAANGQARANVSIAVNRSKKNGDQWVEETYFFNITIWGKTAENLKPYLTKGKQICVEGHLKQDRWEKTVRSRAEFQSSLIMFSSSAVSQTEIPMVPATDSRADLTHHRNKTSLR